MVSWTEELAGKLHDEGCTRIQPCGFGSVNEHTGYYQDRARVIMERLEPRIGAANVLFAVDVILEEIWCIQA